MNHTHTTNRASTKTCYEVARTLENTLQSVSPILCREAEGKIFFQIESIQEHTRIIIIKLCVEEPNLPAIRRTLLHLHKQYPDVIIRESSGYCSYHYKVFEKKIEESLAHEEALKQKK